MKRKTIAIPLRIEDDVYQLKRRYSRYLASHHLIPCFICEENMELLSSCDALLLPGGVDMNPAFYGQENTHSQVNDALDHLDMQVLHLADELALPILGICRGLQCVNVFYGGSLKQDVKGHQNQSHLVSWFEGEKKIQSSITNSFHHQCIDRLAPLFTPFLRSEDGVIEGIWQKEKRILAVQYHPEIEDPFHILPLFISLLPQDTD